MTPIRLGTYPTPISSTQIGRLGELGGELGSDGVLWIKRDDQTATLYGGNKVRKLEHLLGEATREGKSRILTVGAAGSHQVVATALYGKREGFTVDAVLVPQPASDHGRDNLRAALALGVRVVVASSWPAVPPVVAMQLAGGAGGGSAGSYWIPVGGSNPVGSLGFVDAAKEIAAQVSAGLLPEPDLCVVAMGSGGTTAGLAVGFEALEMKTRVVGVAISGPVPVLAMMGRRVAKKTAELVGLSRAASLRAVDRIQVDKRWLGRGYGYSTNEGAAAIAEAAKSGIVLDATYTAKAFACALHLARTGEKKRNVLYWHTLSTASLDSILADAPALPPELDRLFRT